MLRGLGSGRFFYHAEESAETFIMDQIETPQPVTGTQAGRAKVAKSARIWFAAIRTDTAALYGHRIGCVRTGALLFSKCGSNIIAFHSSIPAK
jgi:hypothetical protein